jgi:L-threonylcarbamoyladenylate synthase
MCIESIIGFENNEAVLYRLGSISIEEIESNRTYSNKNNKESAMPGMLSRHYAPKTKTYLLMMLENIQMQKLVS